VDRFRVVDRRAFVRLGPPVAFLLAATVAVLLVRSALHHRRDSSAPATTHTRTIPVSKTRAKPRVPAPAQSFYRIQSGDTFSSVALKFRTTVDRLRALNPGVDPHVLTVGQPIRVR